MAWSLGAWSNPTISLGSSSESVNESAGSISFSVSALDAGGAACGDGATCLVDYSVELNGGASGADVAAIAGTLSFPGGTSFVFGAAVLYTQTVSVAIFEDSAFEGNETFTFTLSNARIVDSGTVSIALGSPSSTLVTIVDNDSNQAPAGSIDTPTAGVTITAGDSVSFSGSGDDPDGDTGLSYLWNFDNAAPTSTLEVPGAITFSQAGSYTVTLTVTDSHGLADPTPETLTVTVNAPNTPPDGQITSPSGNTTISVGESVSFSAAATDPDGDTQLSFAWNFGGAAADSSLQNPGSISFDQAGSYTITLTVTDSGGLPDPEPATLVVTVTSPGQAAGDNRPPDGTIISPDGDQTIDAGGTLVFFGSGVDPDGDTQLSYHWDFAGGAVNSDQQNTGLISFDQPGTYLVALTVTDSHGLADPSPASIQVVVRSPSDPGSPQPTGPTQEEIDEAMQAIATTPSQQSVAGVIGSICPKGIVSAQLQADCNAVVGGALSGDAVNNAAASLALGQATAQGAGAALDSAQISGMAQLHNLGLRLVALRSGATGLNLGGLSFNLGNGRGLNGDQLAALWRGGGAGDEPVLASPWGFFVNGTLSSGDKDQTDLAEGFSFDTLGITAGADYRFNDRFVLGAAFGYGDSDTDLDNNGGSLDSDGYSLSLYATYYRDERLFVDGILSWGRNDFDQRRRISYTLGPDQVDQTANADYDGDQLSLALGGGYQFNWGGTSLTTSGRFEYLDAELDSYREQMSDPDSAGGGWGVAIDSQDVDSLTFSLGGDLSHAWSRSWGVLQPQLGIEWVHEFKDDTRFISGYFIGDPSRQSFSLTTEEVDQNYFNVRFGLSAQFARGGSAYFYYRRLLGYDDLDIDAFGAGVRFEF